MTNTIACGATAVLSFTLSWLLARSCLQLVMQALVRRERTHG